MPLGIGMDRIDTLLSIVDDLLEKMHPGQRCCRMSL